MPVLKQHVRGALEEFADLEFQKRVWLNVESAREMSSFTECVERLFDDSGLDSALETGEVVFTPQIDEELRRLGRHIDAVDGDVAPETLVSSSAMAGIRVKAGTILGDIESLDRTSR